MEARKDISIEEYRRLNNAVKEGKPLKYYSVFEYGDTKGRVHWHYILFNVMDIRNITSAWSEQVCVGKEGRKKHYIPGRSKGKVDVDECNINTIDYVLKYMVKSPMEKEGMEVREKSFQSKGLGAGIANSQFIDFIKREEGNQVVNSRGVKIPLPRYYNKKYLTDKEREKKGNYIRYKVEYEKNKREKEMRRLGKNPDEIEVSKIMARQEYVEKRIKRELKDYEERNS